MKSTSIILYENELGNISSLYCKTESFSEMVKKKKALILNNENFSQ